MKKLTLFSLGLFLLLASCEKKGGHTTEWKRIENSSGAQIIGADKILVINLLYQSNSSTPLVMTEVTEKNGFPSFIPTSEHPYQLKLLNSNGEILSLHLFDIPDSIQAAPALPNDTDTSSGEYKLEKTEFTLLISKPENLFQLQIFDPNGNLLHTYLMSDVKQENNKIKFFTKNALELMDGDLYQPIAMENPATKLDITFINDGYTDSSGQTDFAKFHQDINTFTNNLITYEPIKSRLKEINFHYIDNTESLSCQNGCGTVSRLICCDTGKGWRIATQTGTPTDILVFIYNTPTYGGGSGGGNSMVYNGNLGTHIGGEHVFVHEIGHSLGKLADEYIGSSPYFSKNCYQGKIPNPDWPLELVPLDSYYLGCGIESWYRSSVSSIMQVLESHYFNPISQREINKYIDYYADKTAPTISTFFPTRFITLPNFIKIYVTGNDNVYVNRIDIFLDQVLVKQVKSGNTSYQWYPTNTDYGMHTFTLKAYDAAGNSVTDTQNFWVLQCPRITGDYNLDGLVDNADYNVWRANYGKTGFSPADGNGDNKVDTIDYLLWRKNNGSTAQCN